MISNKEIRSLPLPKITNNIKNIASIVIKGEYKETHSVAVTAEVINGVTVLNVFMEDKNHMVNLVYRYFVEGTERRLYDVGKNTISKSGLFNTFVRLYYNSRYTYSYEFIACNKKTTELFRKAVKELVKTDSDTSLTTLLYRYEDFLSQKKSAENRAKKELAFKELMNSIPKVPKSLNRTIDKVVKEDTVYIFYNRKAKTAHCTCCDTDMSLTVLPEFSEREYGVCPKCGHEAQYLSIGRHPKLTKQVALIQALGELKIVERYFNLYISFETPSPKVNIEEVTRTIVDYEARKYTDYEYWFPNSWDDIKEWRKCRGSMYNPEGIHHRFEKGRLHQDGLTKELEKAGIFTRVSHYEDFVKILQKKRDSVLTETLYFECLATKPAFEHLLKHNLMSFAYDLFSGNDYKNILNQDSQDICSVLRIPHRALKDVLATSMTLDELNYIQRAMKDPKNERNVEQILEIAKKYPGRVDEALTLSKVDEVKLSKYFAKHPQIKTIDYFDYRRNCEKLGYDLHSELVLLPKNFKKAHDDASLQVKFNTNTLLYEEIDKLLPELHKLYDFSDEESGLMIMAPKIASDITVEGERMRHCVGSFLERVAKSQSIILFIRHISKPNTPFVTVEVNPTTNTIVQVRGKANSKPKEDVWNFVEKYKKVKLHTA